MYPRPLQIIGPVGTGKTSMALNFGRPFEAEAAKQKLSLNHVYVNLKLFGSSKVVVYRELVRNVDAARST